MLDNRSRDNLLVSDRIAVTDLHRINDTFEQIKAIEGKIYSLFLTLFLRKCEDRNYGNLNYGQLPEPKGLKELADEIKTESAYLVATYESLKEITKQFDNRTLGNSFTPDVMDAEGSIHNIVKMVSSLEAITE